MAVWSFFDFVDSLIRVRRVGDEALIGGIHVQIQLLKHCLSNQYLVAKDKGLFNGFSPMHAYGEWTHHRHRSYIRIFRYALTTHAQPEMVYHLDG